MVVMVYLGTSSLDSVFAWWLQSWLHLKQLNCVFTHIATSLYAMQLALSSCIGNYNIYLWFVNKFACLVLCWKFICLSIVVMCYTCTRSPDLVFGLVITIMAICETIFISAQSFWHTKAFKLYSLSASARCA